MKPQMLKTAKTSKTSKIPTEFMPLEDWEASQEFVNEYFMFREICPENDVLFN